MAGTRTDSGRGAWWRQVLVLLVVTSGAVLAWVSVRRRPRPETSVRVWSELPTPLIPSTVPEPITANTPEPVAAPEPVAVPEPVVAAVPTPITEPPLGPAPALPGPYPGSVLPLPDGSAPSADYVIKGNSASMLGHSASSPYFGRTRAEVWFRTEQDAIAAGFRPWTRKK